MNYFITGVGTNVGKTIVASVLTEAIEADYWKPIQSGLKEGSDSNTVKSLISNSKTKIHPETYLLKEPLSPHYAAQLDNIKISIDNIVVPKTNNHLIIEGAGGILVPINDTHYVIDIAKKFDCEIVLVISNYLGCINHSLLSIDYLLKNDFNIHSLVFNGSFDVPVKDAIANYAPKVRVYEIPNLKEVSSVNVQRAASTINFEI